MEATRGGYITVLRETAFALGGGITVGLGALLLLALVLAGAGFELFGAWLAAAAAIVVGGFFFGAAREARTYREQLLQAAETGGKLPPGGPAP